LNKPERLFEMSLEVFHFRMEGNFLLFFLVFSDLFTSGLLSQMCQWEKMKVTPSLHPCHPYTIHMIGMSKGVGAERMESTGQVLRGSWFNLYP
jgi:hypothetical protein